MKRILALLVFGLTLQSLQANEAWERRELTKKIEENMSLQEVVQFFSWAVKSCLLFFPAACSYQPLPVCGPNGEVRYGMPFQDPMIKSQVTGIIGSFIAYNVAVNDFESSLSQIILCTPALISLYFGSKKITDTLNVEHLMAGLHFVAVAVVAGLNNKASIDARKKLPTLTLEELRELASKQ